MNRHLLILLSFLAFTSCKKIQSDLENVVSTNPIYKMKGKMNDKNFDYTVNDTSVFMTYGSSEMNGITTFYTEFKNVTNNSVLKFELLAPEKIYQEINQYQLNDKTVPFLVHKEGCYNLTFSNMPPNPPLIYFQENGNFITDIPVELVGYGVYDISVRFKGLSNETYIHTIKHGFEPSSFSASFSYTNDTGGVNLKTEHDFDKHEWFIDDTAIGQSANVTVNMENGLHTVTHIASDNLGNRTSESQIMYVFSNQVKWILESIPCSNFSSNNYGEVLISYQSDGELYSSSFAEENETLKFSIKNIEYFLEKPNSSAISFKFDTEFDGYLYNADKSKKIKMSEVTGTCKYKIE